MICVLRKGNFLDIMNMNSLRKRKKRKIKEKNRKNKKKKRKEKASSAKSVKVDPLPTVNKKILCEQQIKYKLKKT